MVELLSPAGDWSCLRAAVDGGADAVYFGLKELNMRANTKNFSLRELKKAVDYCHENNVRAYLTLNTIVFDKELKRLDKIIKKAKDSEIDSIICWDFSVINLAKKYNIPVHLSTQASVANKESVKAYKKLGVKRIILARELNLKQIKELAKEIDVEVFVHGAMCYSLSGRCFLSHEMYDKSANRGECIHPCRRKYKLTDLETKKEIKVDNNYFLSAKDLCALPFLDKIIKTGVKSLKIEGRNKPAEYVYEVTKVYREALEKGKTEELMKRLKEVYNRKFSSGFYFGLPTKDDITDVSGNASKKRKIEIGRVDNYYKKNNVVVVELKSYDLKLGDEILIIGNKTGLVKCKVKSMEINHNKISKAKKGQVVAVYIDNIVRENDKVYKIK